MMETLAHYVIMSVPVMVGALYFLVLKGRTIGISERGWVILAFGAANVGSLFGHYLVGPLIFFIAPFLEEGAKIWALKKCQARDTSDAVSIGAFFGFLEFLLKLGLSGTFSAPLKSLPVALTFTVSVPLHAGLMGLFFVMRPRWGTVEAFAAVGAIHFGYNMLAFSIDFLSRAQAPEIGAMIYFGAALFLVITLIFSARRVARSVSLV